MDNQRSKSSFLLMLPDGKDRDTVVNLFKTVELYEQKWGSPIQTRSVEEVQDFVDTELSKNKLYPAIKFYFLKKYIHWCKVNDIKISEGLDIKIKLSWLSDFENKLVKDALQLRIYLDALFSPEEEVSTDVLLRAYCWLSYMGLSDDQIDDLRISNVDLGEMSVVVDGKIYDIYREAFRTLKICVERDILKYNHSKYSTLIKRIDGDRVIRGVKSERKAVTLKSDISTANKQALENGRTNLNLTPRSIKMSGIFSRQYERERMGQPIDFSWLVSSECFENSKQCDCDKRKALYRKEKNYQDEYYRWKLIFNLTE